VVRKLGKMDRCIARMRSPGFEPGSSAWEADVLARLDYDRTTSWKLIRREMGLNFYLAFSYTRSQTAESVGWLRIGSLFSVASFGRENIRFEK
jgi:hypothetical protein